MSAVLFRYTNDLRIDAHRGVQSAAELGPVLPVFVIDRALELAFAQSPRRAGFILRALDALGSDFESIGRRLIIRRGASGASLKRLARAVDAHTVAWSARYDPAAQLADARLQAELEEAGLRVCIVHDGPVVAPEGLPGPSGSGYRSFAAYLPAWNQAAIAEAVTTDHWLVCDLHSEPLPAEWTNTEEALPYPDVREPQAEVDGFLGGPILQYAARAKTPAVAGTSHLGPLLSIGRVASHEIASRVRDRMRESLLLTEERASLAEFLRSLARRDFFYQLAWFSPLKGDEVYQEKMRDFAFATQHPHLDAWRNGMTGFPLVDAGMRQLRATGWMHPFVRRVVASFLCFDLGVDWRIGRDEFSRYALDDEPVLATGNWQWAAGVGADLAQFPRIFNPNKQRAQYDPDGRYVRTWVPELASE
ncbi:MAG: FAD-binding domain-containing protein, partial [Vulcanimicrobiaceae bacterium]